MTVIAAEAVRSERMRAEMSIGVVTRESPTRMITSPARNPARSAADPLVTLRTSTPPSRAPKYIANCPSKASHSAPIPLRKLMRELGISMTVPGMGKARASTGAGLGGGEPMRATRDCG